MTIARFRVRHETALAGFLVASLDATAVTLGAAGIVERPGMLLADSGYWTIANLTEIPDAPELLIPRPGTAGRASPARTTSRRRQGVTGSARR